MSIEIIPTGAAIGAEIRGVDLARPIDNETFAAIERAYNDHAVIFLRDQHITPPQQVAFTRRFGEIEFNIFLRRRTAGNSNSANDLAVDKDGDPALERGCSAKAKDAHVDTALRYQVFKHLARSAKIERGVRLVLGYRD